MTTTKTYTIANIAGGSLKSFELDRDGLLSDRSIRHADRIGFGGPVFGGPAGQTAADQYEQLEQERSELES